MSANPKTNTNRRTNRNTNRKPPGHEPDKLVETDRTVSILVDFVDQLLKYADNS